MRATAPFPSSSAGPAGPDPSGVNPEPERYQALGPKHLDHIARRFGLSRELVDAVRVFSAVLPFRVNDYVLTELIDWDRVPADPIFQLVFPQPGMLDADDQRTVRAALTRGATRQELEEVVRPIRARLNPHPAGQTDLNVPFDTDGPVRGLQHKYDRTVLFFPSQGQTCHAYCTYCFRWAQFVGDADLRFAAPGVERLVAWLGEHPEVTDVLVTGGDPMIMSGENLRRHLLPLLDVETVRTIRIGTKAVAYWPQRFTSDHDADDTLRLFEQVVASGRTLAVMAHLSHPAELAPAVARAGLRRVRDTGAVLYGQAPLVGRVNDDADTWHDLWTAELAAGVVPYYLFVTRDTGPREYFEVPLARAVEIFRSAYNRLPGLARTVRGPVMSTTPGKVLVDGVEGEGEGRRFALLFVQARDPALVGRPFRARWSAHASWYTHLELDPGTPPDIAAAFPARPVLAGESPLAAAAR